MKTVGLVAVSLLASLLAGNAIVLHFAPGYLNDERPAWAIVLGAGVRSDGVPYDETRERLAETLKLWNDGLVSRVLVSGGSRPEEIDETAAMANWLVAHGVAREEIVVDASAPRTIASFARAAEVHAIRSALVITTDSHLARSRYLAACFGIATIGIRPNAPSPTHSVAREWLARPLALIETIPRLPRCLGGS
ncbi:MAG: YdcF family protein [Deltaproteobacteria bacterium]|nr:YdcF family protein [Deltaproteobacteria bacterium]